MEKSSFEPGPWTLAPRAARYGILDAATRERLQKHGLDVEFDALSIADSTQSKQIAIIPLDQQTSAVANTSLIMHAPYLYAMTKALLEHLENIERLMPDEAREARNETIAAIREVLSKIMGPH